ncbi:MAG: hypothetical protein H0X29_05065 [Parachlamydiaceae bacterium]|nr:hypothetical protein [Parachlamydiaceae bacterium]
MKPQVIENYLPDVQEQLAGIFEENPSEELFSFEAPLCDNNQPLSISNEALPVLSFASFDLQQQETTMNTETHVYNYASNSDPSTQAELTQRLYSATDEASSYTASNETSHNHAFDTLKTMIDIDAMTLQTQNQPSIETQDIDQTINNYHQFQSNQLSNYLEVWLKRPLLPDHCLQIFHGWKNGNNQLNPTSSLESPSNTFSDIPSKASGGFYLRWNNKGIVVNPGKKFMSHFHQAGLHIKDIDMVIVTNEDHETYADIQEIYELNFRLNRASGDQQIIHYYLNQKAHQKLSTLLKPHSKSERNAIHCLELFPESPEIEQVKLGDGLLLHYFTTQPQFSLTSASLRHQDLSQSNLGIRLELSKSHLGETSHVTIGYLSNAGWTPFVGQHLANCDLLLAGIGNTNQNDYSKIVHLDECLGYYGVCSLLEDTMPKLLICTEFGSREGDLRLELIKKMRSEYQESTTTILPGDIGMYVDLQSLSIKCSITHEYVNPSLVKVMRSSGLFGIMNYLAPSSYL